MNKRRFTHHDEVIKVRVPFSFRKRGGRKLVVVPAGATAPPAWPRVDDIMTKAIARAFRWRGMLEAGTYGTIEELAKAEKINPSYVSRVLRMTLLAPNVVTAILEGRKPPRLTLTNLMRPFPGDWDQQDRYFLTATIT